MAYRYDHADKADWIAQYFFTGGIMPSHGLVRAFDNIFTVERDWRWNGKHYERTARDWLDNFDRNRDAVPRHLRDRLRQGGICLDAALADVFSSPRPGSSAIAMVKNGV
jgi:cyclopropane fatty-acyl-phospholipid synthase-like methyltransferase